MIIKRNLKIKKHKPGFLEWVLNNPQAFAVVMRLALMLPILLSAFWVYMLWVSAAGLWIILPALFLVISVYNLKRFWLIFKSPTHNTIANTVWGSKEGKQSYDEFMAELKESETEGDTNSKN